MTNTTMLLHLVKFNFSVRHHPGRRNVVADHLPHLPRATMQPAQSLPIIQQEDSEYRAIIESLTSHNPSEEFNLEDTLYCRSPSGEYAVGSLSVLRPAVLQALHACAGRFGTGRTLHNVQDRYWWPNMGQSIQSYVSSC